MVKDRKRQSQLKGYLEDDQYRNWNQAVDISRRPDTCPAAGIELAQSMSFNSCNMLGPELPGEEKLLGPALISDMMQDGVARMEGRCKTPSHTRRPVRTLHC